MKLTPRQQLMIEGKICPYCGGESVCVDSSIIYLKSYGMCYLCTKCDAYVGVHKGTDTALGRLANKELRELKKEAHHYFDMIWRNESITRDELYQRLSEWLKIPRQYTHIGMFSPKTCKDVIYFSKQLLNDLRRLDLDFGVDVDRPHYKL